MFRPGEDFCLFGLQEVEKYLCFWMKVSKLTHYDKEKGLY